jgi:hypothetical protein
MQMMLLLTAFLALTSAGAHPGHGSALLVGTLVSFNTDAVTIEVRDLASLTTKRIRVLVSADTKYRQGKERVQISESHVGSRIEILADYEEGPRGDTTYSATEIKLPKPKVKR